MVHESLGATAQGTVFGVSLGMVQLDDLMCTGREDPLLQEVTSCRCNAENVWCTNCVYVISAYHLCVYPSCMQAAEAKEEAEKLLKKL